MKKYPTAATVLKRGFFVDNLLWSVETVEEAIQLQDKLIALLRSGGFELHKWASNCMPLLERMPGKLREMPVAFDDDKDLSIKVLGLQWLPLEDVFSFPTLPASSTNTKRGVLSQIGRQFDPLGFVAPCIFFAKCFMQKLWMLKLGWDDQLPSHLSKEWHAYTSELHLLSNFKHERQVTAKQFSYHQILGFCDASTLGYAAVIYLLYSWMYSPQTDWPIKSHSDFISGDLPELKLHSNVALIQSCQTDSKADSRGYIYDLSEKYSSFTKLQRVLAKCIPFFHNCKSTKSSRIYGSPSLSVLKKAQDALIKAVQNEHFSGDMEALQKGRKSSQSLRKLSPFLDELGFLRVGGRLAQSNLPYQKRHPLLLPKKCIFTRILRVIDHFHKSYLHAGPRTLQSVISQKYWIISARSIIRSQFSKCVSCFKVNPPSLQHIMGNLIKFRSQGIHSFHTVGVDIGGRFYTKENKRRNSKISKAYLCMFVCFATRAVHIESLTAPTTGCFMAALDRFTARRGLCHTIVSDNGRNFVAAGRQLVDVLKFFRERSDKIENQLVSREIHWKYNPPTGSHFGGMYESAIKSAKLHLKRVVGNKVLSFEELTTIFTRVEAVLNSRPLCSMSTDPSEFEALTPGHFLVGRELLSVPEYEFTDEPINRLSRWQLVQQASQRFWNLWRQNYLHTLQQKQRWLSKCRDLKQDELVLIHSNAPPLHWHLGRVTKVYPESLRLLTVNRRKFLKSS
nr:unnamed protein product [Callosobruchus analis]